MLRVQTKSPVNVTSYRLTSAEGSHLALWVRSIPFIWTFFQMDFWVVLLSLQWPIFEVAWQSMLKDFSGQSKKVDPLEVLKMTFWGWALPEGVETWAHDYTRQKVPCTYLADQLCFLDLIPSIFCHLMRFCRLRVSKSLTTYCKANKKS